MRPLSILEIIRALPIEEETKKQLTEKYPTMSQDDQLEISQTCWAAFHKMKKLMEESWRERIIEEIANGKRTTDIDLEEQVFEEVWKEIEDKITGKSVDDGKLDSIRTQLQTLMHEPTSS